MRNRKEHPGKQMPSDPTGQLDQAAERNWLGRLVGTLNFVVVIIFISAWITAFIFLRQFLSGSSLAGNILTDLSCLSFFGGMIIAFLIAAVASNLIHRFLWKFPFIRRSNIKD